MTFFFRKSFFICLIIAMLAYKCYGELKVAVMDTGLNLGDKRFEGTLCPTGHTDFTGKGLSDEDGHGTHVAGLITKYAGKGGYCLVILKYYDDDATGHMDQERSILALQEAIRQSVNIINLSGGGPELDERELMLLKQHPEILLIGAAGNGGMRVRAYPGCMGLANTRCVGALDKAGKRASFSNYGAWVDVWQPGVSIISTLPNGKEGPMSGTSMSTAIESGLEIKRRLEHALRH